MRTWHIFRGRGRGFVLSVRAGLLPAVVQRAQLPRLPSRKLLPLAGVHGADAVPRRHAFQLHRSPRGERVHASRRRLLRIHGLAVPRGLPGFRLRVPRRRQRRGERGAWLEAD